MIRKFFSIALITVFSFTCFAQIPDGYYTSAEGKTGALLKTALYNIVKGHTSIGYDALYVAYKTTDNIVINGNNTVWDMYSIRADGTADYYYTHQNQTCGNYSSEGDCYNREHSMPQSWFNSSSPMVSDLFHVYPTDGKVNGMRSNYPFGKVGSVTYTSSNDSKLGTSDATTGYSGKVFEPIDEFKGDFARTYFYMATRYEDKIASWATNGSAAEILDGSAYPAYKEWYLNLMIQWHNQDPVSAKEIARNDAVYNIQHNRNPFIDHPEYVSTVWGGTIQLAFTSSFVSSAVQGSLYLYSVKAQGASGATLTITCPTKPTWLNFATGTSGQASLTGTPTASNLGDNHVILSLTDGTTAVLQDFMINVTAALPLDFSSTPVTETIQGAEYVYSILSQGPSGTTYTITCPTKPTWLTFQNLSNGIAKLSGIAAVANIGDHEVVLTVSDGVSFVNQEFTITVSENTAVPGGTETFTNIGATSSSYSALSWTGDDGSTWTSDLARTDQTLNGTAICLKHAANTYLQSGALYGGCGSISYRVKQAFTGSGGTLTLFINGIQIGSPVLFTTTEQLATFSSINIDGSFVIKLVNSGTNRPIIDDLTWTGYSPAIENVLPDITNISLNPLIPNTGQPITVAASISDSDGTIQEAYLNWGSSIGGMTNKVSMILIGDRYEGIIPAQSSSGTIYYTINAKDNSGGESLEQSSFDVTSSTHNSYEVKGSPVTVYPNPAKNTIIIEATGVSLNHLSISNIIGKTIIDIPFEEGKHSVDIRKLNPGIYFVIVSGNNFKSTTKIVVY